MTALKAIRARLRALLRRRTGDRELDAEILFHLEQETAKHVRRGVPPDEARRLALLAFGGIQQTREAHRSVRGAPVVEEVIADSRFALRTLARSPMLAGAAVLTLALGIGANAAIFSAVNAVILRPLPFTAPERLVMLWEENAERDWRRQVVAPANMLDWKARVPSFEDVAGYADFVSQTTFTGSDDPVLLTSVSVTGNFFGVLGVNAQLGRPLLPEETWQTGEHVAVISDRMWRTRLGADPEAVGRPIQLGGRAVRVVGVMPDGFDFPRPEVDLWIPTAWAPTARAEEWFRRAHWMRAIARLRAGSSATQAEAELQVVARALQSEHPVLNRGMGAGLTPLQEFLVGDTRRPLLILLGAVALLLLIACANVGNLLLVQAAGREREIALRLAIGAGRARLIRQAITESLVLSTIGGAAGLLLGWWGTRALAVLQPAGMLRVNDFDIDLTVLGFITAITAASGLLFGVAPAAWSSRRLPADALREGGRAGSDSRRMRRWGDALVVGEVAVALLLAVGAGLLVRSFWELQRVDPGFRPDAVLAVPLTLPGTRYDTSTKLTAFHRDLLARLSTHPDIEAAAFVGQLPLTSLSWSSPLIAEGRDAADFVPEVVHRAVSPDYFRTMSVPLLRGRGFAATDDAAAPQVVVINEALAQAYFRSRDPIGQRIVFDRAADSTTTWHTIVGVVGSEHQESLTQSPRGEVFAPFAQDPRNGGFLVVRRRCAGDDGRSCDPLPLAAPVRRAIGELDPLLASGTPRTMASVYADSLARQRFLMTLLLVFAAVGLSLAVVGVYGVLAHLARRRTREMGIRIALGARASQVRWLVVRHGLRLTMAGLVLGGVAALAATRAMTGLLYRIEPEDPVTILAVAMVLAATSLIASWLPAVAASRADAAAALRAE